jgi:hypothetical protein
LDSSDPQYQDQPPATTGGTDKTLALSARQVVK